jgi:DNA-binding response OmpR family regulator
MNIGKSREIKGKLLVVENHPEMKMALKDVLEDAGYRVESAANGEDGLNLFITFQPDLIISDITMPVMDGHQLLHAVRSNPSGKFIPFIFLSAYQKTVKFVEEITRQSADFLIKPISKKELLKVVHARMRRVKEQ